MLKKYSSHVQKKVDFKTRNFFLKKQLSSLYYAWLKRTMKLQAPQNTLLFPTIIFQRWFFAFGTAAGVRELGEGRLEKGVMRGGGEK